MRTLRALTIILLGCTTLLYGQTPQVDLILTVSDNAGGSRELRFGLDPTATDGIDGALGESEQPPLPPSGLFDARFLGTDIGVDLGQGTLRDYRQGTNSTQGTRIHELGYQVGSGTTITISWNLPQGVSGHLQDLVTGLIIDVLMSSSGQYTVNNPGALSKLKMTITYAFEPTVTKGGLNVSVVNVPGWSGIGDEGRVYLYNRSGQLVDSANTNTSEIASFTNIAADTGYVYKVYRFPTHPDRIYGVQYWGQRRGIAVTGGLTTAITFERNMPYTSNLHVYNTDTNQDVTWGVVSAGTPLRFSLEITNPNTPGAEVQPVKGRIVIDQSKTLPYDSDQTTSTWQTMAVGEARLFNFDYTPWSQGEHFYVSASIAEVLGTPVYTEGGQWRSTPVITVQGALAGEIHITVVNNAGWSNIGTDGLVHLYDNAQQPVATASTDSGGVARFGNVQPGSGYSFSVFRELTSAQSVYTSEFWGQGAGLAVTAGQTTSRTFERNMPYTGVVTVFSNGGTVDVTGDTVAVGTPLRFRIELLNPSTAGAVARNVKPRFILDRDKVLPFEYDTTLASYESLPAGGNTYLYIDYAPTVSGDIYHLDAAITDILANPVCTEAGRWIQTPLVTVDPGPGQISLTVQNNPGWPEIGAEGTIYLYNRIGQFVDSSGTSTSGVAVFTDVPADTGYYCKVFHHPTSPEKVFGPEYWGQHSGIAVIGGQTTSATFARNMPYATNVRVYDRNTNQDVTLGVVAPGTPLRFSVEVTNPNTVGAEMRGVKARIVIDRNKTLPFDSDQSVGTYQTVTVGGTTSYDFEYTPTNEGEYFSVAGTIAEVSGTTAYTDGGQWEESPIVYVQTIMASASISTSPNGLLYFCDGQTLNSPGSFQWAPGSFHALVTYSPQPGTTGTQYVWDHWSDGGDMAHSVLVLGDTTITAVFRTEHNLSISASPGGKTSPQSGWFPEGMLVPISAEPDSGYEFVGWVGSGAGSYTGPSRLANISILGPISQEGVFSKVVSVGEAAGLPTDYFLGQNYPNPFNPSSRIGFGLPASQYTRLEVYSTTGEIVATLVDRVLPAGYFEMEFKGLNLPSGMYFYRLKAGDFVATKKMLLVR